MTTRLILLASVLPVALPIPTVEEASDGRSPWGDEFCRNKYCAVMTTGRQDHCCLAYKQCCAYVEMHRQRGMLGLLNPDDSSEVLAPSLFNPREIIYVGPPKSMRLREDSNLPPSLSLIRHHQPATTHHHHHHRHHHHHHDQGRETTTTTTPRPAIVLLDGGTDLLASAYNDQLIKDHERMCKHSYCSLLTPSQHKLCCNVYDACCAYSEYRTLFDPFHVDNRGRRR